MNSTVKRVLSAGLLTLLLVMMSGAAVSSVAADCENPTSVDDCDGDLDAYEDMLGNMFEVAHTTLQYAGFITVFAGAILWFTARRSSDRAQTGVWLLIGGLAMILFYFGFTAFVSALHYIAQGGG